MQTKPNQRTRLAIVAFAACVLTGPGGCPSSAGTLDPSQGAWHEHYRKQPNAPDPAQQPLNRSPEPNLTEGFEPLFNGTDLAGWTARGGRCTFAVEDGVIVGRCVPGSPSTYLCTDKEGYTDFVFTCEVRWEVDGNTGVQFRSRRRRDKKGAEIVYGPQAEMEGFAKRRGWSGGVYGQSCGGYFYPLWLKEHAAARAALKPDAWNRLTISAEGKVVKTWVNGVPAAHWVDKGAFPKGFFALQVHQGKQGVVRFRGLRIKEPPRRPAPAKVSAEAGAEAGAPPPAGRG